MAMWAEVFGSKLASDKEVDDFATYLTNELNEPTVCDPAKVLKAKAGGGFYVQVMTMKSLSQMQDPRPKIKNPVYPLS